jgi:hypothetical protein
VVGVVMIPQPPVYGYVGKRPPWFWKKHGVFVLFTLLLTLFVAFLYYVR